jgi:hypothetical protein
VTLERRFFDFKPLDILIVLGGLRAARALEYCQTMFRNQFPNGIVVWMDGAECSE